jgi:hypothetical protein
MSYLAILVATIAAFAAIYEARINREHQAISVWPYLQMWPGIALDEPASKDYQAFSFHLANKGVGPAIIEDLKLTYKGNQHHGWQSLLVAVARESDMHGSLHLNEAGIESGEVIEAGEIRRLIESNNQQLAHAMSKAIYADKSISYAVCYCSLYEECWKLVFPSARPAGFGHPPNAAYIAVGD